MNTMTKLPDDHPLMRAWLEHRGSAEFNNSKSWAAKPEHLQGSLWALFMAGWNSATERAASLHESVNVASDTERSNNVPGADAMGAVIEYRDLIRDINEGT